MRRIARLAALFLGILGCEAGDHPAAPFIRPAPAVALVRAEVAPGLARITWAATDGSGLEFEIQRRLDGFPWKRMVTLVADVEGLIVLEDPSVQPGQTYSYRVRAAGVTTETFQGEVTIVVPAG